MKNYGILLLIVLFLTGCSASGKKTLFRENRTDTILKNIGVVNLAGNIANLKLLPQIATLSDSVIKSVLPGEYDFNIRYPDVNSNFFVTKYKKSIDVQGPVAEFCRNNNLDGVLFVSLELLNVQYTVEFIPLFSECHAESVMILYGKDGKKLLSTGFNTLQGDTYTSPPGPEQRVKDAIQEGLNWTMYETMKLNKRSEH